MATKKVPAAKAKKPVAKKATAKPAAKPAEMKPIKTAFTKAALMAHLAEQTGVEPKSVKAVMACLEATAMASVSKKGLGEFMLPGLLKVVALKVSSSSRRRHPT
jgi:hypothetical protein